MVSLSICVGSSCHLKGSYEVIQACRDEIKARNLEGKVELKAAFCLGECGHDGVAVKVAEEVIPGVRKENVSALFDEKVMPLL